MVNSTRLVVLVICISSLLLDITEVVLFAIGDLRPVALLVFQCVKMVGWFVGLVIGIVVTTERQRRWMIGGGGGVERYSLGLLVLLDGLLEGLVLVYVQPNDRSIYNPPSILPPPRIVSRKTAWWAKQGSTAAYSANKVTVSFT